MYPSHVSNGIIAIQGLQTGLPNGAQQIGPYSVPCSPIGQLILVSAASTNVATPVPSENSVVTNGVIINTSAVAATYSAGFISNELTRLSQLGYPCIWTWDPAAVPSNVYCTVSNAAGAYLSLQFF